MWSGDHSHLVTELALFAWLKSESTNWPLPTHLPPTQRFNTSALGVASAANSANEQAANSNNRASIFIGTSAKFAPGRSNSEREYREDCVRREKNRDEARRNLMNRCPQGLRDTGPTC